MKKIRIIPLGIQVLRIESRLLRLLKAVFIPITMKYFDRPLDSVTLKFKSSDKGAPLSSDSCADLAAASSISKCDIVLSRSLGKIKKKKRKDEKQKSKFTKIWSVLCWYLNTLKFDLRNLLHVLCAWELNNFLPWLLFSSLNVQNDKAKL